MLPEPTEAAARDRTTASDSAHEIRLKHMEDEAEEGCRTACLGISQVWMNL